MNIVIPMAGRGQRFVDAGFESKPFADVNGKPMIQRVIENLRYLFPYATLNIITSAPYYSRIHPFLRDGDHYTSLTQPTRGAVETILLGSRNVINTSEELVIANCDQLVDLNPDEWALPTAFEASILTFPSDDPSHSYVRLDPVKRVARIVEKRVVSGMAVVGLYRFQHGSDFVEAADRVIARNEFVKGEFYVSSVLQEMADSTLWIGTQHISATHVHMLGTPEQLRDYLEGQCEL